MKCKLISSYGSVALAMLALAACGDDGGHAPCSDVCACVCGDDHKCASDCHEQCTTAQEMSEDPVETCRHRAEVVAASCDYMCDEFADSKR